jgi:branched-chain amino acid transport system ATP-binding protein
MESPISLHGVTFDVRAGEVVTLLGRNGAGKTTTLKSIMGIVGQRSGSVRHEGRELIGLSSNTIARQGIAFCPEERAFSPASTSRRISICRPR